MPDEFDRKKLLAEKAKMMEQAERLQTEAVREEMLKFLLDQGGYSPEDIERDREFRVSVTGCEDTVSTDFIIRVDGRRFMAIKCAAASVDTRERHITSFARVVDEHQIPFSLVTDGENTRLIDTYTGKVISEDIYSIPSKEKALRLVKEIAPLPYPPERMEKEKRILLAFETIRCPNVKS